MTGTGFPYVILLASMLHSNGWDFVAVYGESPCWVIDFENQQYQRWVFSSQQTNEEIIEMFRPYLHIAVSINVN